MHTTVHTTERSKRVLLADDDHALRMMLGKFIATIGFEVTYAENGKVALALYRHTPDAFALLITDLCMPEMSGDDLIREIRQLNRTLPIIAITGFALPEVIQDVQSHSVALFEKPLKMKEILVYINSIEL